MPTNSGGVRRLIFVNNTRTNYESKYVPGSSIGSYNTSVRRALKRRATSQAGKLEKNNTLSFKCKCPKCRNKSGCPCRPAELSYNPSNLAFPHFVKPITSPNKFV